MEKSFVFNSINGDRKYLAEDFREYFASFIGNGVFPNPSTGLQVYSNGAMTVTVKEGKGWINGAIYVNTDDLILSIDPADGVLNRIDRIVLRFDTLNREIKIYVKRGTFASSPNAPVLQRDADIYELALADINIKAGSIEILQSNINDLRLNSELCGIVVGTVKEIDTTTLYLKLQAYIDERGEEVEQWIKDATTSWGNDFNYWFETVKDTLDGDTAGNLLNKILELVDKDIELEKKIGGIREEIEININSKLEEVKQSGSNFKDSVASAITAKGVSTSGTDKKQTFVNNIGSIDTKTPIAPDELGVIEWKDGTNQGFKEIDKLPVALPEDKKIFKSYAVNRIVDNLLIESTGNDYILYVSGTGTYTEERTVSKIFLKSKTIAWDYISPRKIRQIEKDSLKNIYILKIDGYLTKLNNNGQLVWEKQILINSTMTLNSITIHANDYIYGGTTYDSSKRNGFYILKIDPTDGNLINNKIINKQDHSTDYITHGNYDNYIYIISSTTAFIRYIYKYDENLNLISEFYISSAWASHLNVWKDGSYYVFDGNNVVKLNPEGTKLWQKGIGSSNSMVLNDFEVCYINRGDFIARVDSNGNDILPRYDEKNLSRCKYLSPNLYVFSRSDSANLKVITILYENVEIVEGITIKTNYNDIV